MVITKLVSRGQDILVLEATTPEEEKKLKEFGRPWEKLTAELHDDPYYTYPCLIIRKET